MDGLAKRVGQAIIVRGKVNLVAGGEDEVYYAADRLRAHPDLLDEVVDSMGLKIDERTTCVVDYGGGAFLADILSSKKRLKSCFVSTEKNLWNWTTG